jgi:hypothetical protein
MNENEILTLKLHNNIVLKMKMKLINDGGIYITKDQKGREYLHLYGNTFLLD